MGLKVTEVVAAVIVRGDTILATQRGYGEWEGWWEFPGGKVEQGETPEQALVREIHEELGAAVEVGRYLCTAECDYPTFHLSMRCYVCSLADPHFELLEHHAARWLTAEHIDEVKWLPADIQVVDAIRDAGVV
ncbi:MAG: (deoxy)nucleoside triphosphate pyrophosphohydrolase [Eggerthellaceae bacterium]|nr:(deoxy)nucleoside triphosphate pyrophosphohydrolase [Eggerthellaceae bacterium]